MLKFQLFCLRLWNSDLFTGRATLSRNCCFRLTRSTAPAVSTSECSTMKSQLTFTPESVREYLTSKENLNGMVGKHRKESPKKMP
ncbi:uncharacterized protein LOC118363790 isoform X2 [Oncorhynchus keta]|uniref:uncharacterized protein LOC118363790 isoform X2 n=1 Tax=Oncorhynchus keta TaxID=8018 RepID=UPI00227A287E|nr:uncharacterized protein LOC118363790 isoform X2 [Oncorhynchus keta]